MESRHYPDVPYKAFHTQFPRVSAQSELDTLGELLPNLPSYQTEKLRKTYFLQDSVEPSSIVVETQQKHQDSDPDIDEVLEPPAVPRTSTNFLKEAWQERPIRQLHFAVQQSPSDQENSLNIRILRLGGDFELTYYGRNLGLKHVLTNEDLTLLIWHEPRNPRKRKDMNVFELLEEQLVGDRIVLGTMRDREALKLKVASSNTVERLMPERQLNGPEEKAKVWSLAFHRLVTMQLQSSVYRS